jgi:hypothetical protein
MIPAAQVTLTNTEQNRSWTAATNAEGAYIFVQIPPGKYTLAVEAKGFKKYEHSSITLEVAQIAALDVAMELGSVSETVEVTSQVALLETASSTLDAVVNHKTAESLPLIAATFCNWWRLLPASIPRGPTAVRPAETAPSRPWRFRPTAAAMFPTK